MRNLLYDDFLHGRKKSQFLASGRDHMDTIRSCPPDAHLSAFHLGMLPNSDINRIANHVETCRECNDKLRQIERTLVNGDLLVLRRLELRAESRPEKATSNLNNFPARLQPDQISFSRDRYRDVTSTTYPNVPGYEILGCVGQGGMGIVYQARHLRLNRLVALKMVRKERADALIRFQIEAEAIGQLQHPHIVQIFEIGCDQHSPYMALEWVEGGSLADYLKGKPQKPKIAAQLLVSMARAIDHAHRRGIIHRDLKPANILMSKSSEGAVVAAETPFDESCLLPVVKITDFGLAKRLENPINQTQTGEVLGTPDYMAPEQAFGGNHPVGPGSDIYALGAILYEMLIGRPPFQSFHPLATLDQVRTEAPTPPRSLQPNIPRDLETICLTCLNKNPNRRYKSAEALAEDLQRFLNSQPIVARRVGAIERIWMAATRYPLITMLMIAVMLSLSIGIVVSVLFAQKSHKNAQIAEYNEKQAGIEAAAAVESKKITRWALADKYIDQGLRLAQQGEDAEALLWFCEAKRLANDDPLRAESCSVRIRGWAKKVSRPVASLPRLRFRSKSLALHPEHRHLIVSFWPGEGGPDQLWDLDREQLVTIPSTFGTLNVATWSPDGSRIAIGTREGRVFICRFPSFESIHSFNISEPVSLVQFSPTGNRLLTIANTKLYVWDHQAADFRGKPQTLPMNAVAATFSPDGTRFALNYLNNQFTIFSMEDEPKELFRDSHHIRIPNGSNLALPRFSKNGLRMLTYDGANLVYWDLVERKKLQSKKCNFMLAFDLSPDGSWVLLSDLTLKTLIVHADSTWKTHSWLPYSSAYAKFSTDGRQFLTVREYPYASVSIVDTATGQTEEVAAADQERIYNVAWSDDAKFVVTESHDHQIRVWGGRLSKNPDFFIPGHGGLSRGQFSPDNNLLLVTNRHSSTQVYQVKTKTPIGPEMKTKGLVEYACFTADSSHVATISANGMQHICEMFGCVSGDRSWPPVELPGVANYMHCLPRSSRLLISNTSGHRWLLLIDGKNGKIIWKTQADFSIAQFFVDAEGSEIYILDRSGEQFAVLDSATGAIKRRFIPAPGRKLPNTIYALSSKGLLVSGTTVAHSPEIWNVHTGERVLHRLPQSSWFWPREFSSDGRLLLTNSQDHQWHIWDVDAGRRMGTSFTLGPRFQLKFTFDGKAVFSVCADGFFDVLDIRDGRRLLPTQSIKHPSDSSSKGIRLLETSPDGRWLFVGSLGGYRHLPILPMPDLSLPKQEESIDDLANWAELVSFRRVNPEGNLDVLSSEEWQQRWKKVGPRGIKPIDFAR